MPKKIVDPIIESVTLEPELEEALASASDAELCDIAGDTHTHTLKQISTHTVYAQSLLLSLLSNMHIQFILRKFVQHVEV